MSGCDTGRREIHLVMNMTVLLQILVTLGGVLLVGSLTAGIPLGVAGSTSPYGWGALACALIAAAFGLVACVGTQVCWHRHVTARRDHGA